MERHEIEPTTLTVSEYESKALSFLDLEGKTDKLGVLRRGLVEEACEIVESDFDDEPDEAQKEVGDVIWYCTALAHMNDLKLSDVLDGDHPSLDDAYSHGKDINRTPITGVNGELFNRSDDHQGSLIVDILRLVDTVNPKTELAWEGVESNQKPDLKEAIRSVLMSAGDCANDEGFTLDTAAMLTLDKLATRKRKPHVIEEADEVRIDSMRMRLMNPLGKHAWRLSTKVWMAQIHEDTTD